MATPSSVLAWRIPGTEEPGGLQSMGTQRVDRTQPLTVSLFFQRLPEFLALWPLPVSSKPAGQVPLTDLLFCAPSSTF